MRIRRLSTRNWLGTGLLLVAGLFAHSVNAADPLKVGFVYVGPTGDAGWTY